MSSLTLGDLINAELGQFLRVSAEAATSSGPLPQIRIQALLHFQSNSKCLALHILSADSQQFIGPAIKGYDVTLASVLDGVNVQFGFHEAPTHGLDRLIDSRLLYLYIESALDPSEVERLKSIGNTVGLTVVVRDWAHLQKVVTSATPVAFICHDYLDKNEGVADLAFHLYRPDAPVWYDDFSVKPGDILRDVIESGIRRCPYGIIVITPNFLANQRFARAEFEAIFTKDLNASYNVIIPIWKGVSMRDVFEFSPNLASRFAIIWEDAGVEDVARRVRSALVIPPVQVPT